MNKKKQKVVMALKAVGVVATNLKKTEWSLNR